MLDIAGSTPIIELNDTDTGVIHRINANSSAGILYFYSDVNNVGSDGSCVFRHGGNQIFSISSLGTLTLGPDSGKIRRSGDIDTYINFDGSDDIEFVTGNVERLRITSGGLVGIGTDNPGSVVHALGSYGTIRVENSNTDQYAASGVELKGPAGDERSTKIIHGNSNTGGTETYFQIEQYDSAGSYVKTLSQYNYQFDYWAFHTGASGTERVRIDSSGNVGIGTDSPTEELHIAATAPIIRFEDTDNGYDGRILQSGSSLYLDADYNNVGSGAIRFRVGGANEHMRIDSVGNVGIGTNNPQQKLHLKGVIQVDGFTNTINGNYSRIYQNSSGSVDYGLQLKHYQGDTDDVDAAILIGGDTSSREGNIVFYRDVSGTLTESARIDESGNFGIGTNNPAHSLTLDGANPQLGIADGLGNYSTIGVSKGGAGQGNLIISTSTDTDSLVFQRGATESMRINSSGYVGINETDPDAHLHVVGNSIFLNSSGN